MVIKMINKIKKAAIKALKHIKNMEDSSYMVTLSFFVWLTALVTWIGGASEVFQCTMALIVIILGVGSFICRKLEKN